MRAVSFVTRLYSFVLTAIILLIVGILVGALVYEYRHPCLRYSTQHIFVPESTTYIATDGGIPIGDTTSNGGVAVPVTTPAHYEDQVVCEERK
jgi:hypothetical protein